MMNDIDEYQEWTKTTIGYETKKEASLLYSGLIKTIGEMSGLAEKFYSGEGSYSSWTHDAKEKLGTIQWYLNRYADSMEWKMSDILEENIKMMEKKK